MRGPAPKRNVRRRNARPEWRKLPREGRQGSAPEWPQGYLPSLREQEVWTEVWKLPQAVAWEEDKAHAQVARYVALWLAVMELDGDAKLYPPLQRVEDNLGLSPLALRRLMWEMDEAEEVERVDSSTAEPGDRLRLLTG